MLIAKISFYFESAKKTGEKFREKLGFQNHCPHPYHPPNRYQDTMNGLYATHHRGIQTLVVSREMRVNICC